MANVSCLKRDTSSTSGAHTLGIHQLLSYYVQSICWWAAHGLAYFKVADHQGYNATDGKVLNDSPDHVEHFYCTRFKKNSFIFTERFAWGLQRSTTLKLTFMVELNCCVYWELRWFCIFQFTEELFIFRLSHTQIFILHWQWEQV